MFEINLKSPEISVIMPVYNGSEYLKDSIQSILNQTFENFEFIILNDKSTDNSLQIIEEFKNIDSRIIIINQVENIGPALLRNRGIQIAKGKFIALMDADDISDKYRFDKQMKILKNNKDIGICGSWFTIFGKNIKSKIIKHSEFHDQIEVNFIEDCNIGNPTVMLRSEIAKNNSFNENFVPIEDYQLWASLLKKNKFYNIQESLLSYRWHENNISKTKIKNILSKHDAIRKNLLADFSFTDDELQTYITVFKFENRLKPIEIKSKIIHGKKLIELNNKISIYNKKLFENKINEIAKKTISKSAFYDFKFLVYLICIEKKLFFKLNFIIQIKVILKSIFNFKKT